jgi:hypothetical protein
LGFWPILIVSGILATIFGGISIHKRLKYPDKYKGLGWSITSLVFGILEFTWLLVFIVLIMFFWSRDGFI